MRWLQVLSKRNSLRPKVEVKPNTSELVVQEQTKALVSIGESLKQLSNFVSNGGLTELVKGYTQTQIAQGVLQGLASHDGRNALDARYLKQNAIEIVHAIEAVFDKAKERTEAASDKKLDPELKNAEDAYQNWKKAQEKDNL